eukprot:4014090-Alexandrium_andersonii.AAC.1
MPRTMPPTPRGPPAPPGMGTRRAIAARVQSRLCSTSRVLDCRRVEAAVATAFMRVHARGCARLRACA